MDLTEKQMEALNSLQRFEYIEKVLNAFLETTKDVKTDQLAIISEHLLKKIEETKKHYGY